MGSSMLDRLAETLVTAGRAWDQAHAAGALEAGTEPERYLAYCLLVALRDPTDRMVTAGDDPALGLGPELVDHVWRQMVDAALRNGDPED